MINKLKVACVIPCFKETKHIMSVLKKIESDVDNILLVDDGCPDKTGEYVLNRNKDPRVEIIFMKKNLGVGGATMAGYKEALKKKVDIVVKIDGDGQMDPSFLKDLVSPIVDGKCDYTKGNRFFYLKDIKSMPKSRIFGNICLSFLSKFSSGFWQISDPTNGFTAIHKNALESIELRKISHGYFFESDILCKLYLARATVVDVPLPAVYGSEESGINVPKIIPIFIYLHIYNFLERIFYTYLLRDFSFYSLNLVIGTFFMSFGFLFGVFHLMVSLLSGIAATAGTVMISALPILIGFFSLMQFMSYDVNNTPKIPLQKLVQKKK